MRKADVTKVRTSRQIKKVLDAGEPKKVYVLEKLFAFRKQSNDMLGVFVTDNYSLGFAELPYCEMEWCNDSKLVYVPIAVGRALADMGDTYGDVTSVKIDSERLVAYSPGFIIDVKLRKPYSSIDYIELADPDRVVCTMDVSVKDLKAAVRSTKPIGKSKLFRIVLRDGEGVLCGANGEFPLGSCDGKDLSLWVAADLFKRGLPCFDSDSVRVDFYGQFSAVVFTDSAGMFAYMTMPTRKVD